MARARFGEIWSLRGAPEGACYAIVSDDGWNDSYPTLFVVELACRDETVALEPGHRVLTKDPRTVALANELATVHESLLAERVGHLSSEQMSIVAEAMSEVQLDYCIRGAARPVVATS